jgi:hypothetical protein
MTKASLKPAATHLYLVLLRSGTVLSRAINIIGGQPYTHASLAFDKELQYMFSFSRRYPRNPFIGSFSHDGIYEGLYEIFDTLPGVILELDATEEQYWQVSQLVGGFIKKKEQLRYNYLGLFSQAINLSFRQKDAFYCAEFVYYVLHRAQVCDLGKPPEAVRPSDFLQLKARLIYHGDLKRYLPAQKF